MQDFYKFIFHKQKRNRKRNKASHLTFLKPYDCNHTAYRYPCVYTYIEREEKWKSRDDIETNSSKDFQNSLDIWFLGWNSVLG